MAEKTSSLEAEAFKTKRLHEELVLMRRKVGLTLTYSERGFMIYFAALWMVKSFILTHAFNGSIDMSRFASVF